MDVRTLVVTLLVSVATVASAPARAPEPRALALVGGRVYTSPDRAPIDDGAVLVRGDKVVAVGRRGDVKVPADAEVVDCSGLSVAAGFWNCHVHFSDPGWQGASAMPAERLEARLREMLTAYGFTTVVDTGSDLANTVAMRRRVASGDVRGPQILTAGSPMYPKEGTPIYLREFFEELGVAPPEVGSAAEAAAGARERIAGGADVLKLFTASPVGGGKIVTMPADVVRAVTREAHRRGRLVYAHPQSSEGVERAIECGVDVLAHATPVGGPWDARLVARMRRANISLVPTLTLWRAGLIQEGTPPEVAERVQATGVEQLRAFVAAGGRVLFGTDVGYVRVFDTAEEFEQMKRAGMDHRQILASLTTAPAARFGARAKGVVEPGRDADLVVLAGDPAADVRAFSQVRLTIRAGRVIYRAPVPGG